MVKEKIIEDMQEALAASYEEASCHIYARLMTRDDTGLDPQCVTITWASHLYALVADYQKVCCKGSVVSYVTHDMLGHWHKTVDDAARCAFANLENDANCGFVMPKHSSADVCDGRLLMHGIRFRSALAARYAAGMISSTAILKQVYRQLGSFYIYLFGADEKNVFFCRASDMAGINVGTPLWWDRCFPPRVAGPVLRFDGSRLICCSFDMRAAPPKNYPPKERVVLLESLMDYI